MFSLVPVLLGMTSFVCAANPFCEPGSGVSAIVRADLSNFLSIEAFRIDRPTGISGASSEEERGQPSEMARTLPVENEGDGQSVRAGAFLVDEACDNFLDFGFGVSRETAL